MTSSLVTVTFPTRFPKRLASKLRINGCKAKEADWIEHFTQRSGHVIDVRPVRKAVEVDIWLGELPPVPSRPVVPLPPDYLNRRP